MFRLTRPKSPRGIGIVCATIATGLGLLYMAAADAPTIYLAVNGLSLVMGLALVAVIPSAWIALPHAGGAVALLGAVMLATASFGISVEGASRWIRVAGLSLQVSIIVVPFMLVVFARTRDFGAAIGVTLAAVALAFQPDRAMAGVLLAALAVLAMYRPDRLVLFALSVSAVGFAITLVRADTLPAVAYVDQILYTAFQVHPLAGIAVLGGSLLLIVPGVTGQRLDPANREVHAVFGTVWLTMVVAAALGNYPTPLVGYGGSAILGYALSLTPMPGYAQPGVVRSDRAVP